MKRFGNDHDEFAESHSSKKSRAQIPIYPDTLIALSEQYRMSSNANGAQMPGASLAKNLFQDMGKQVESMKSEESADTEAKVVEEIESLCMNCREDVSNHIHSTVLPIADMLFLGHDKAALDKDPLLP